MLNLQINRRLRIGIIAIASVIGIVATYVGWRPVTGSFALDRFMADHYGRYDAERELWIGEPETDADVHYAICTQKTVNIKGEEHVLVAVCGDSPDKLASPPTPGLTDLYVLKYVGWELVEQSRLADLESGMFGHPGATEILKLGANFYGFKITSGWVGQGYVISTTELIGPSNSDMKKLLTFTTSSTFEGREDCQDESCQSHEITRELIIDDRNREQSIYPLTIAETQEQAGKISKKKYAFKFSRSLWAYTAEDSFLPIVE